MPGLDLTALSTNWKRLQATLQPKQLPDAQSQGTKRKRSETTADSKLHGASHHEKPKYIVRTTRHVDSGKRRKMGSYMSKENGENAATTKTAATVEAQLERPSARSSLSNGGTALAHHDRNLENQGLHPTNKPGKYIGLDCEMVGTGPPPYLDHVLARVSLVNYHGEQIYDSYVLPPPETPIHDYRTFVSGIRPEHLKPGFARPFREVQKVVADLLQDKILVGHALKNDLEVLVLSHPKRDIRDTAKFPAFRKFSMGKAPSLKKLAKIVLARDIQEGEHSSVEDARAAMELFKSNKEGFELLTRQLYGAGGAKGRIRTPLEKDRMTQKLVIDDEGDEEEEDEDEEEDDGDQGEDNGEGAASTPRKTKKKKKKHKKRTKRA